MNGNGCRFPQTAQNGSSAAVVLKNPWANGGPSAPFDQRMSFFLVVLMHTWTDVPKGST
jgi:hypothetical protein